jgi:uncharacterized membrane protein YfcA
MDFLEAVLLAVAGFAAGAVNAVAGGGTLISFPALVAVGYSAKVANVTNTVAIWPGYVGGWLGYRAEISAQLRRFLILSVPSILGALAGAALLLQTSEDTFEIVAPFLILFAAALLALQEKLTDFASHHRIGSQGDDHLPPTLHGALFLTGIYGAYFGAGLGIMNFAILMILLPDDIQNSNALKTALSLVVNGVAAVSFALFGPVAWTAALVMAGATFAGGYIGVGIARRLGPVWLKRAVIAFAIVFAAIMLASA